MTSIAPKKSTLKPNRRNSTVQPEGEKKAKLNPKMLLCKVITKLIGLTKNCPHIYCLFLNSSGQIITRKYFTNMLNTQTLKWDYSVDRATVCIVRVHIKRTENNFRNVNKRTEIYVPV